MKDCLLLMTLDKHQTGSDLASLAHETKSGQVATATVIAGRQNQARRAGCQMSAHSGSCGYYPQQNASARGAALIMSASKIERQGAAN